LAGADIARSEGYKEGTMAINTLKSDIDYAHAEAMTTYGKLGVKVWICRGEKVADEKPSTPESKKGE
ncbi:MAG: 30S ribosomal protein S3, partial [Candidatus Onthovivens sp.]|nr:30S ribosomal protein S3 [Candidatus Onthovivens sp.]